VRWTENRNMLAFLQLLSDNKLNLDPLITHEFPFEKAPDAYDLILHKTEPFTGVVLKYDHENVVIKDTVKISEKVYSESDANVSFIGTGSFAQNIILPNIKGLANLVGVADAKGNTSRYVAEKYDFGYATSNPEEIFKDINTNTIFIATRHDSHAKYVIEGLKQGKNIFVEKPLALKPEALEKIKQLYQDIYEEKFPIPNSQFPKLMIGFNRRFAPHSRIVKKKFNSDLPKSIMYRIIAGKMPADHWVHDPEVGGGRIIGEVCHFIDLAMFFAGHPIKQISAQVLNDNQNLEDTLIINLGFSDGSIATINYFSNGNNNMPKEYIEIFSGGQVAVINDFKSMILYGKKKETFKQKKQDKGHKSEIEAYIAAIKNGLPSPIPFEELYNSSLATFKVIESLRTRKTIEI
jgi:polar amino acid transport system substrate-binding protein